MSLSPSVHRSATLGITLLGVLLSLSTTPLQAQEDERAELARQRWVLDGELTGVFSRGNARSATLGFGAVARREWDRDKVRFEFSYVTVETGVITRVARGTATDFEVERDVDTRKTAEHFLAKARYDRKLTERMFVYGAGNWERNTFAGIDSRTVLALGGGRTWIESERTTFSTDAAVTYTFQTDVVENPDLETTFAGLRAGWNFQRVISASADFESHLTFDQNLMDTEDRRFDFRNALTVDVNEVVALKPSLQLLWRNLPSLGEVPLVSSDGGAATEETVLAPLEKLDTILRIAVVLKF